MVADAKEVGADGISYTYNEPTIFIEYALDVARIAKKDGLFNVFVTNGYMSKEATESMAGLIDAVVVDFKGNGDDKFANKYEAVPSNAPIKETLLNFKKLGIHIELTDLVVPQVGDSLQACDELTKWIASSLGAGTPLQFTRFYPSYKMQNFPETPIKTLEEHYKIAKSNGLNYVYIGNVLGTRYENTYCPVCGAIAIKRNGFAVEEINIDEQGRCRKCGTKLFIKGTAKLSPGDEIFSIY